MKRSSFVKLVAGIPALGMVPRKIASAQVALGAVTVFRAVPVLQADGGQLNDVAFSYNFAETADIFLGHYGNIPPHGTLRFTTPFDTLVFRRRAPDGNLTDVLAQVDIRTVAAQFDQTLHEAHPNGLNSDLLLATAKYGYGDDEGAIGHLNPVLWDNEWDSRARLIRADAFMNLNAYDRALRDYQWIIRHRARYSPEERASAHLGRAKIARIFGDTETALQDYDAVLASDAVADEPAIEIAYLPSILHDGVAASHPPQSKNKNARNARQITQVKAPQARFGSNPKKTAEIAQRLVRGEKPPPQPKKRPPLDKMVSLLKPFRSEITQKYHVTASSESDAPNVAQIRQAGQVQPARYRLTVQCALGQLIDSLKASQSFFTQFTPDERALTFGALKAQISNFASFRPDSGGQAVYCSFIVAGDDQSWASGEVGTEFSVFFFNGLRHPGDDAGELHVPFSDDDISEGVKLARNDYRTRLESVLSQIATPVY